MTDSPTPSAPSAEAVERAREIGREIRKHLFVTQPTRSHGPLVEPGLSWEANEIIAAALDAFAAEREAAAEKRGAAGERQFAVELFQGWRECDWPEGFDRRTAEIIAADRVPRLRARSDSHDG